MIESILIEVVADLVFLVISIIIGWLAFILLRRRKLLRFFGIQNSKRISIYLSNLQIISKGSIAIEGRPGPFKGTAVVFQEAVQANSLQNLFNYRIPGLREHFGFLRHLLVSDIEFVVGPSPLRKDYIDATSCIITFGSSLYNVVSKWAEDELSPPMRIDCSKWSLEVDGVPEIRDPHCAFVQRLHDSANERMVFYVAGLHETSTIGAIDFLAMNWRNLQKSCGTSSQFSILLRVDRDDYRLQSVVAEKRM